MFKEVLLCSFLIIALLTKTYAQQHNLFAVNYVEKETVVSPGQVLNLAFMVKNNFKESKNVNCSMIVPNGWRIVSQSGQIQFNSEEKKLVLFTVQVNNVSPVGNYNINLFVLDNEFKDTLATAEILFRVKEIENISLLFVGAPQNVKAGESLNATYLVQNSGNTKKKVYIETQNCDVIGPSEIEVNAGESEQFFVTKQTSSEIYNSRNEYYIVRAVVSGDVKKSIYRSYTIFPVIQQKKDLYFRFPVSAKVTYVASNLQDKFESGYQFQISGEGTFDPEGKHQFSFLARGPNLSNLSYLGLYDQYFVSYSNKNIKLFVGDKAYSFTPLTESSRFGHGLETSISFNNGINLDFIYVKPTFFEKISNEIAGSAGFKFNKQNEIKFFYIQKNNLLNESPVKLASALANLSIFEKTNFEFEFSRGKFDENSDNAFRTSLNTQFWIFYLAGVYFYTGKNYPGYYSNSKFYSGNISARVTEKLNFGVFLKEDFSNAELDTFFVTAPYTKSFQSSVNYNIAQRAYLKFYWRQFERKDRLDLGKFHYKTKSLNSQFSHKIKKIDYSLRGEYGTTTNLLLTENNQQTTYRGVIDLGYHLNSKNSIKFTGSWSNINSFVSNNRRNVTAGLFVNSQISKNLKADFYLQNAYDIDDYYRNRNLMQLNLEYKFLKHHVVSARSFYTLFKQQVGDPEFTATLTYAYNFGIPLKEVIKAGEIKGHITYDNDNPAEGVVLNMEGKAAITDENGEFYFSTVQPGMHYLFVDRSKFEINEITSIPLPINAEVLEDHETVVNFKITTGTKLAGRIFFEEGGDEILIKQNGNTGNIIVELNSEFDQFRITTDREGNFSFPLVRSGDYTFKIFENSIPEGYELENSEYHISLSPGEEKNLEIELKPKKRDIIFKSMNVLTPVKKESEEIINETDFANSTQKSIADSVYYSVQVGAFSRKINKSSNYFKNCSFDFERLDNGTYKYFVGKYSSLEEAKKHRDELELFFKNPFVVIFKDDVLQK